MTTRTRTEVMDGCSWLRKDYEAGGLLAKNVWYDEVYHLNIVHKVSDEASRGFVVTNPTPRLSEWVNGVVSQTLVYPTFPVLTSVGSSLTPSEADKLEASAALMLSEWNRGQMLTDEAYRGFLKQTHVVYQLVPGAPSARIPFDLTLPAIDTVFFERFKGGHPAYVAREYEMLAKDFVAKYSNKKGKHEGARQMVRYDAKTKQVSWEKVSGEYREGTNATMTGFEGYADKIKVREFDDGEAFYHYCCTASDWDDQNAVQQEVYREDSPYGGTSFVVIPSSSQGAMRWDEEWRPIGWPGYTRVNQIDRIEQQRGTLSEQSQEHVFMRMDPADQDAVEKLRSGGYSVVLHGGANMIPVAAQEIVPWKHITDEDLAKRAQEKNDQLERWIQSWQFPATQETTAQANVGTAQLTMQAVHQQETQLLTRHTRGLGLIIEMAVHALSGPSYIADRELYAASEAAYGPLGAKKVQPGSSITLGADTLKKVKVYGPDANIRVDVVTRSETEAEQTQRLNDAWNNKQRHVGTLDAVIQVINPDVTGQYKLLAEDEIDEELGQTFDSGMPRVAAARLRLKWGLDVSSLLAPTGPEPPLPGAGGAGGGAQPRPMPESGGIDVTSAGGAMHAGAVA